MEYFYRNTGGDELLFIHHGAGVIETQFGELAYREHDYMLIPTGTTYRLCRRRRRACWCTRSTGSGDDSAKYRNEFGQLEEHAPYYERDFRAPLLKAPVEAQGEYEVRVTNGGAQCNLHRAKSPVRRHRLGRLLLSVRLQLEEFAPITGKLHQPPPAHATFEAPGAAFCAFVPRLFDYHPLAIPVPYNHSSVDCDEVLYYVSGNFMSRRGVEEGSITLHAAGAPHGPQPGAVEQSLGKTSTDEIAVMVDTFKPLALADAATQCEDPQYYRSWIEAPARN